jgi:hypothetical protein
MDNLRNAMKATDWALLSAQKQALVMSDLPDGPLDGLLNWIDALQDAAEKDGFPVVWLEDAEEQQPLMRCLRCDTVTGWDFHQQSGCPHCGYSEGEEVGEK